MSRDIDNHNIFGLSASQKLTKAVCDRLMTEQHLAKTTRFADGEILVQAKHSVREKDLFVIQSTSKPVNENLMELLIAIDAFKRASARKINVIIPYFGYARQDRKSEGRQPITAKLVANLIERAGANRVILIDVHSAQEMGFFDIPVDNLSSSLILSRVIRDEIINKKYDPLDCILVSPDHGGLTRVHNIVNDLQGFANGVAVIAKRRPEPNKAEIEFILGDVKDKICFISDDMIDTGGTIINAAKALKNAGAKKVYITACHGLFNSDSKDKFESLAKEGVIESVTVTDTIELPDEKIFSNLKIVSVAEILADTIDATIDAKSLSYIYYDIRKENKKMYDEYIKKLK